MSNGQRFEAEEQRRFDEEGPVVARQGRLALGWVVAIMVVVALFVLLVVALMLRSGWWIDEGPVAALTPAKPAAVGSCTGLSAVALNALAREPLNELGGQRKGYESKVG